MQASFYIIVRNGFFMNFSIHGSSAWWSRARMVRMTALDNQISLRNPTAMLEDSMTSVKTLYMLEILMKIFGINFMQIEGVDDDSSRVIIKFTLSNQVATLSQFAVQLVTREEYKKCSKDLGKNTSGIFMPVFRLSIST